MGSQRAPVLLKPAVTKYLPHAVRELQHITPARLLIALGRVESAIEVLDTLLTKANGLGRMGSAVHILVPKALAFDTRGDTSRATHCLARAFDLAQTGGYVHLFADEGESMARLLRTRGPMRKYVKHLLDAF